MTDDNLHSNGAPTNAEIAAFAYEIWTSEGMPPGKEREHWRQAEAQLQACRAHESWTGAPQAVSVSAPGV